MSNKKVGVEFGEEVAGRTIVGGRGTVRKKEKVSIPVGIEKVLYLAATDAAFRDRLFSDREGALAAPGLRLGGDEELILRGVPDEQLKGMIGSIDPARHGRRKFIRSVAACAAMTSVTGGAVFSGCGEEEQGMDAGGARPDLPDGGGDEPDLADAEGLDANDMDVPKGPDAGGLDARYPDAGDSVDVDVDAGQTHGILPDASEEPDAADGGSPDHVEIDYDAVQPAGILPDAGEEDAGSPDHVEIEPDGGASFGILPDE